MSSVYGTPAWRAISKRILEERPLCETATCKRRSQHVDHRVPRAMGGTDDDSNLVALCNRCHGKKTARERRGDVFEFLDPKLLDSL